MSLKRFAIVLAGLFMISGMGAALAGPGGIPRVIGWASTTGNAGITWGAVADITPTQAGVTYNGTSIVQNVPTGKSFSFTTNGVAGGTVLDAMTFTADVTLNGGTGALGFGAGETIVPADAVLNVTGGITASAALGWTGASTASATTINLPGAGSGGFTLSGPNNGALTAWGSTTAINVLQAGNNSSNTGGGLHSIQADGATAVAWRVAAYSDYATAGAKIASFGDYAGTSYAEKAYIGLHGGAFFAAGSIVDGTADEVQLTVQGHSTQVSDLFVVETSDGTDLLRMQGNGLGFVSAKMITAQEGITVQTGNSTFAGDLAITGNADELLVIITGNATQTALPFTIQNSVGTDLFTVSNTGIVTATGAFYLTDTNVGLIESGTNDLDVRSDGAVSLTVSGGATPTVAVGGALNISRSNAALAEVVRFKSSGASNDLYLTIGPTDSAGLGGVLHWDNTAASLNIGLHGADNPVQFFADARIELETIQAAATTGTVIKSSTGTVIGTFLDGVALRLAGGFAAGVAAVQTTTYVATVLDYFIPADVATTGDVTITLPAASASKGQTLMVKATSLHVTRDININRAGADTITTSTATGATTVQLSPTATYNAIVLVSDGTATWYVVNLM